MISGYGRGQQFEEALKLYRRAVKKKIASPITFVNFIDSCQHAGQLQV